jgi:hypothetical protein
MLDTAMIRKIEEFVYAKPRTVDEIAKLIDKNWRTADRYVQEIEEEHGTISTRVFREGTRGALKLVFGINTERISNTVFQQALEEDIFRGKMREDFTALDIFQYVPESEKGMSVWHGKGEQYLGSLERLGAMLLKAENQMLLFSGNLSFAFYKDKKIDIFNVFEELVKRGVSIKVVCRVDPTGEENIRKLLALNYKYGKELIEIRHREQPLRLTIIDKKLFNMKDVFRPTGRDYELKINTFGFYTVYNQEWLEWITKIFWKMFSHSIDAQKRLEQWGKLKPNPSQRRAA